MKYLIIVNAVFAVALAQQRAGTQQQQQQKQHQQQPQYQQQSQQQQIVDSKYRNIPNVAHENILEHDGTFSYSFENGDGTRASQNGQLRYVDQKNAGEAVQGGYSFQVRCV